MFQNLNFLYFFPYFKLNFFYIFLDYFDIFPSKNYFWKATIKYLYMFFIIHKPQLYFFTKQISKSN